MRLKYSYPIAALMLVFVVTACSRLHGKTTQTAQTPTSSSTPYSDGVRRVTIEELEALLKEDKAVVIDVRGQDAYDVGHIPGSKSIPAAEILNHLKELPRDKLIVTYCS